MTTIAAWATLMALATLPARAGGSEEEVEAVIQRLSADWNAADMTAYMAAYVESDDLRLLSSAGIYKGWDTVNTTFREQFPDEERMGDFTTDAVEVRLLSDDVALASGAFEHVFAKLTIRGSFSHVLRRQDDGRWLIELEHVSRTEVVDTGE
jgi:uncharacterized protein (TIGR02246 family)